MKKMMKRFGNWCLGLLGDIVKFILKLILALIVIGIIFSVVGQMIPAIPM